MVVGMSRMHRMTPEGLEELILVNGVLVWPPEESTALLLHTSIQPRVSSLSRVFSHTLRIVLVDSARAKENV